MLQNLFRIYLFIFLVIILSCDRGGNILIVGSISGPGEVAEETTVEFSVDASSDSGITYKWVVNPVGFVTLDSPNAASTTFTAPEVDSDFEIVIRVVVNSGNDGPVVRSLDVLVKDVAGPVNPPDDDPPPDPPVNQPPTAAAHVDVNEIIVGDSLQFYDDSTDPDGNDDIVLWEWDFTYDPVDGFYVESMEQEPLVEFAETGVFDVQLRVTDSGGLADLLDEPLKLTVLHEHPVAAFGFTFGGNDDDRAMGIGTDPDGFIFVASELTGLVELDPGDGSYQVSSVKQSGVICKYDAQDFQVDDANLWDGSEERDFEDVTIEGFTSDNNGNFYITGNFGVYPGLYVAAINSGGTYIKYATSSNLNNEMRIKVNNAYLDYMMFVAHFNQIEFSPVALRHNGDMLFIQYKNHMSQSVIDVEPWISTRNSNLRVQLYIHSWAYIPNFVVNGINPRGEYNSFGVSHFGIVILAISPDFPDSDNFIKHYTFDGTQTWEISPVVAATDSHTLIRSDTAGNFYLLNINENNITKISPDGVIIQELSWDAEASDIYVYDNSSFLVTGTFFGTVDFDPGNDVTLRSSPGTTSGYVSAFDPDGNFQWVETWGDSLEMYAKSVTADNSGNIYVCGSFSGNIDLGPPWESDIHYSNGGTDAFVLKLSQ